MHSFYKKSKRNLQPTDLYCSMHARVCVRVCACTCSLGFRSERGRASEGDVVARREAAAGETRRLRFRMEIRDVEGKKQIKRNQQVDE